MSERSGETTYTVNIFMRQNLAVSAIFGRGEAIVKELLLLGSIGHVVTVPTPEKSSLNI